MDYEKIDMIYNTNKALEKIFQDLNVLKKEVEQYLAHVEKVSLVASRLLLSLGSMFSAGLLH